MLQLLWDFALCLGAAAPNVESSTLHGPQTADRSGEPGVLDARGLRMLGGSCLHQEQKCVCRRRGPVAVLRGATGKLEARVGIEPTHKGFADLSLTTWVPRLRMSNST